MLLSVSIWCTSLTLFLHKILHVSDERVDAGLRHGIVNACAHAADRAVALELHQARGLGALEEFLVQRRVRECERHVHPRTAVLFARLLIKTPGRVDIGVELLCLTLIESRHRFQAAPRLQPLEYQTRHVPGIGWRRVVHRAVVGVYFIVEYRWRAGGRSTEEILAHNH